jgi:type IV pilus assembly protein PilM
MASVSQIGLDIGSMSIRAVETSRSKDGPVITGFGQVVLPLGAVQSGVIQNDRVVTEHLRQLWAAHKFRTRDVVLGVTNTQVVVREMAVANLPTRELRRSLPFQVRELLPLPVDQALLDFCPLEEPGGKPTVRGLMIAAPKEAVLTAVRACEQAGLRVTGVDLASFAVLRATSRLDAQVEAIVDIGAYVTSLIVHYDGEPLIVRTIPRGGAEITDQLANRMNLPLADAEILKRRTGLWEDEEPEVAEIVLAALRPLVNELRTSFTYLTSAGRQATVTRLVLAGGGALLPGLADALVEALDIDVFLADPVLRVRAPRGGRSGRSAQAALERAGTSAAVSIGLTLGVAA